MFFTCICIRVYDVLCWVLGSVNWVSLASLISIFC
jgi:hypothetical protein